jgi:hypothetical protein
VNERVAALWGILVAETGASVCLGLILPNSSIFRTVQTPSELLGPQICAVLLLSAVIAIRCWIMAPKIWRLRQQMSSKFRALALVSVIVVLLNITVTLGFFELGTPWSDAAAEFDHGSRSLILALAVQGASTLLFYWLTIAAIIHFERKRIVQVTPNPKFGRH